MLFRQTRDTTQVGVLARQIFGGKSKEFLTVYNDVMKTPYNYLVLDIHPANIHRVSVHLNILPNEKEIIYLP